MTRWIAVALTMILLVDSFRIGLSFAHHQFRWKVVSKDVLVPHLFAGSGVRKSLLPALPLHAQASGHDASTAGRSGVHDRKLLYSKLDLELAKVSLPAFVSLAADPLASIVDAIFVAKLGAAAQAAMGVSISAQYSVAKLYNDPLLKTSTSLVAGKEGEELQASVTTALVTAIVIGSLQAALYLFAGGPIMSIMGVSVASEMRAPALRYLRWRALGVPASTVLLVVNSIFRGRGDTQTPLFFTFMGTAINILLCPLLIFSLHMGCAGAGAATAISQWTAAIPLVVLLHRKIAPLSFGGNGDRRSFRQALQTYIRVGSLLLFRTMAKVAAYAVTSSAAARLGTVPMAAYALTFNLGSATSQLCESISIATQSILAREYPYHKSHKKRITVAHVIRRALLAGIVVSSSLSVVTWLKMDAVLRKLTSSDAVFHAAKAVMPVVLLTQLLKGLVYSTGGILLGGLDFMYSTMSMTVAAVACVVSLFVVPRWGSSGAVLGSTSSVLTSGGRLSLNHIWQSLALFMGIQVVIALARILSATGPWKDIPIFTTSDSGGVGDDAD